LQKQLESALSRRDGSNGRQRFSPTEDGEKYQTLEQAERALILATVKDTKWVLSGRNGAATRLGVNRSTLQFRMRKLGIARPWTCEWV